MTADIWYTWTRPIVGGDNQKLAKLKSVQKTGGCVEKLKSVKKNQVDVSDREAVRKAALTTRTQMGEVESF